jgi:hypothetical protein
MQYDLAYSNTHIVDLNRSKWDRERSDRKRGVYFFYPGPDAKVYIKQSDYMDAASRPNHLCKFVGLDNVPQYRSRYGAELVTIDDPYWPEPIVPDAEGKYVILDAVLVKISDIEGYVDSRQLERERAKAGHLEDDAKFNADARAEGVHLDLDRLKK